jgi:hypothetical protein
MIDRQARKNIVAGVIKAEPYPVAGQVHVLDQVIIGASKAQSGAAIARCGDFSIGIVSTAMGGDTISAIVRGAIIDDVEPAKGDAYATLAVVDEATVRNARMVGRMQVYAVEVIIRRAIIDDHAIDRMQAYTLPSVIIGPTIRDRGIRTFAFQVYADLAVRIAPVVIGDTIVDPGIPALIEIDALSVIVRRVAANQ